MNLREQILTASDNYSEVMEVAEWGGAKIKIRSISGADKAALLKDSKNEKGEMDPAKFYPMLLIAAVVDPINGTPVFEPADRDALFAKRASTLEKVAKVAARVCGFTDEGMEGNSAATASVASFSDSPNVSAAQ